MAVPALAAVVLAGWSQAQSQTTATNHPALSIASTNAAMNPYSKPSAGELKQKLTPIQYSVTQQAATEPPFRNDFWDTKKFPGKRGMRKGPRYNLEFALMADGVAPADVYKVLATKDGADRAFKKMTELKPNIQFWEAGAQPPQFLVAGDVVMTTAYNGRIDAAQREGKNLAITWTGGIYDLDYWVMPKGTPNKDLAMKFIAMATNPTEQAEYTKHISYGPTNNKALAKIDPKILALLPTSAANSKTALQFNITFWADQGEALEKRFAAWAAQ